MQEFAQIQPFSLQNIADVVLHLHYAIAVTLFIIGLANLPMIILFCGMRVAQLRNPRHDMSPTATVNTALHYLCAFIYGLLFPSLYFLAVRQRWELGPWHLGSGTHTAWTIGIGVACLAWLVVHFIEAALRMDRLRFSGHWLNRLMALTAVLLCVWHIANVAQALPQSSSYQEIRGIDPPGLFIARLCFISYPLLCYFTVLMVYGFALAETFTKQPMPTQPRRWKTALVLATIAGVITFSPYLLSIPRVTHRQAMALLAQNHEDITTVAAEGEIDPRLLAGIIYVAQTRDHPRITGDILEEVCLNGRVRFGYYTPSWEFQGIPNPSMGLCQIRHSTAMEVLSLVEQDRPEYIDQANPTAVKANASTFRPMLNNFLPHSLNHVLIHYGKGSVPESISAPLMTFINNYDPQTLFRDNLNSLRTATAMLILLREQWDDARCPIDDRPEILATLYNIGFQRSHPHSEPEANDFGRRVLKFMESEECIELFPEEAADE